METVDTVIMGMKITNTLGMGTRVTVMLLT